MAEYEDEQTQGLPDWLSDPRGILRRRWLPMLATLLIGLAATVAITVVRKPVYSAEATVLLAPDIPYDTLVQVMDTVRVFQIPTPPFQKAELFPDISVGDAPT